MGKIEVIDVTKRIQKRKGIQRRKVIQKIKEVHDLQGEDEEPNNLVELSEAVTE